MEPLGPFYIAVQHLSRDFVVNFLTWSVRIFYKILTFFGLRQRNSVWAQWAWSATLGLVGG